MILELDSNRQLSFFVSCAPFEVCINLFIALVERQLCALLVIALNSDLGGAGQLWIKQDGALSLREFEICGFADPKCDLEGSILLVQRVDNTRTVSNNPLLEQCTENVRGWFFSNRLRERSSSWVWHFSPPDSAFVTPA